MIAVAAHFGKPEEYGKLLKQAKPVWLAIALLFQAATYVCAGSVWARALARQGQSRPLLGMVRLGIVKVFMDQAVPSAGISGNVLVARALGHRGLSYPSAVATVLAGLISFYIANGIAVAASLVVLWVTGNVSRFVAMLVTGFAVVLAIFLFGLLWITRGRKQVPALLRKIKPLESLLTSMGDRPPPIVRDVSFFVEGTALQLALIALDAATLWAVIRSLGATVSGTGAFTAFTMATVVSMLSPVPAGLGTFEGAAIGMLRAFQVPIEAAVAGTVLLRGMTFILPLIPGVWLARTEAVK